MRRACAVCGCSLGPDIQDPIGWDRVRDGEPVSHGYCPEHLAEVTASLAARCECCGGTEDVRLVMATPDGRMVCAKCRREAEDAMVERALLDLDDGPIIW